MPVAPSFAVAAAGEALAGPLSPLLARAERVAASVSLGAHGRRRPGVGEAFWEHRPHRREDGLRRVDWRRSARGDQLYVRENELEAVQTVLLWRDPSPGMAFAARTHAPTKADRALLLLAALASLLTRGGERVGVLGDGQSPRTGRAGFHRAAHTLAAQPPGPAWPSLAHAPRRAGVVLATDGLAPLDAWEERFAALAARQLSCALLLIAAPEEEDFPFHGYVAMRGTAHAPRRAFGRIEQAAATYRRRYAAHFDGLRGLARARGWPVVSHRTDAGPAPALLALSRAIEARGVGAGRRQDRAA